MNKLKYLVLILASTLTYISLTGCKSEEIRPERIHVERANNKLSHVEFYSDTTLFELPRVLYTQFYIFDGNRLNRVANSNNYENPFEYGFFYSVESHTIIQDKYRRNEILFPDNQADLDNYLVRTSATQFVYENNLLVEMSGRYYEIREGGDYYPPEAENFVARYHYNGSYLESFEITYNPNTEMSRVAHGMVATDERGNPLVITFMDHNGRQQTINYEFSNIPNPYYNLPFYETHVNIAPGTHLPSCMFQNVVSSSTRNRLDTRYEYELNRANLPETVIKRSPNGYDVSVLNYAGM